MSDARAPFQVWHANPYACGENALFPHDYRHVANISTETLAEALSLATHIGGDWRDNPDVVWMSGYGRSTGPDDVLVDPDGQAYRVERSGFEAIQPATDSERLERDLQQMKEEPEIHLESTRRYVMPDLEDMDSVYDTCDTLGPWETLTAEERLAALRELDWRGVGDADKRQIIERETGLVRLSSSDPARVTDEPSRDRATPDESARTGTLRQVDEAAEQREDSVMGQCEAAMRECQESVQLLAKVVNGGTPAPKPLRDRFAEIMAAPPSPPARETQEKEPEMER